MPGEGSDHTVSGMSIPAFRSRWIVGAHGAIERGCYLRRIRNEPVGPLGNRDRPLGVGTHGETWNPKRGRFFLQSSGVRDDRKGMLYQIEHLQISDRFENPHAVHL